MDVMERDSVQSMYSKHQMLAKAGDPAAVTLWDVATDMLGQNPKSGYLPQAVICVDTPFGRICFEAKAAELDEKKLKTLTLGDILADTFSRPRIKGTCYKVCNWGICVEICV